MNTWYTDGALEIHRIEMGRFTTEEVIRNFFDLKKQKEYDDKGNVANLIDEMLNPSLVARQWVADFYKYEERLNQLWVTEQDIRNYFPYVQFNERASVTNEETPSEWGLHNVSDAPTTKPRKSRKQPTEQG